MDYEIEDKEPKKPAEQKRVKISDDALEVSEEKPARRPTPTKAEFFFMLFFAMGALAALYWAVLTHSGPVELYASTPVR